LTAFTRWIVWLSVIAVFTSGCSVNPVTGKQQFSLVSPEQEVAIGAGQYKPAQQSQGGRYYLDPEVQAYVNEVGQKLARVSDRSGLPYEFVVLNSGIPNAWALPGGKIAINRGLLMVLDDEAELAAVLSHEIVHAAARHGAAQMTRGMLAGIGLQVLGSTTDSALGGMAAQLGTAAWMARYGRSAELESDAFGIEYMVRAGYDPYGAVGLQQKFVELSQGRQSDLLSSLFASHPPSQERVTANLAKAKTYPAGGTKNKARYQQKTARIKKDQPAYEAQDEAMAALRKRDARKALTFLDKAIALQPREGQFWELRGHAWKILGDQGKAREAFTTAISKNPDYFSHHLARGILAYEQDQPTEAKPDLLKSHALLPTPYASLYLGEIALAGNDRQAAIKYLREAAGADGEVGRRAKEQLAVLEISENPNQYIASQTALGKDGYLYVTVQNRSTIPVSNVVVQTSESINAFLSGPSRLTEVPGTLKPGQSVTLKTPVGPLPDADSATRYRALVIKAAPVTQ